MPPSPGLSRRAFFASAATAGLGLAGCSHQGARTRPTAARSVRQPRGGGSAFPTLGPAIVSEARPAGSSRHIYIGNGTTAADAAAFGRFDPSVTPIAANQAVALRAAGRMPVWAIMPASPPSTGQFVNAPYPLDEALHLGNFDPAALVPGAVDAFVYQGKTVGLPLYAQPFALAYQPAVFAAAGATPPNAEWTFDDLGKACMDLRAAGARLAPLHVYGPLPPLVGRAQVTVPRATPTGPGTATVRLVGTLSDGILIQAFVAGYGGWLTDGGFYNFTNPGAVRGLTALAAFAGAYGAPESDLLAAGQPGSDSFRQGAAMDFRFYTGSAAPGWRFARLPRLPVAPVVPATLTGLKLGAETGHGQVAFTPAVAPVPMLQATVRFALWQYGRQKAAGAATRPGPVVADAAAQARYWADPQQAAAVDEGAADWPHYLFLDQGVPPGEAFAVTYLLYTVLSAAATRGATGTANLKTTLAAAEQSMNALVAQRQRNAAAVQGPRGGG